MVTYYDVMSAGYELLKEEVDVVYGGDAKDKSESTMVMAGIVNTVYALRKLFEGTEKEDEKSH